MEEFKLQKYTILQQQEMKENKNEQLNVTMQAVRSQEEVNAQSQIIISEESACQSQYASMLQCEGSKKANEESYRSILKNLNDQMNGQLYGSSESFMELISSRRLVHAKAVYNEHMEKILRQTGEEHYLFPKDFIFPPEITDDTEDAGLVRWKKLLLSLKRTISCWTPETELDFAKENEEFKGLVNSLKEKMTQSDDALREKMMIHFFPELGVSERIVKKKQEEALDSITPEEFQGRFEKFVTALYHSMEDIIFWGKKLQATEITAFEATGSDLHERGLGVNIVTYKTGKGEEKKVIKPEVKSVEYRLLAKSADGAADKDKSFAELFNRAIDQNRILIDGKTIKEMEIDGKSAVATPHIRTLDMQIDARHGTMVEYVNHDRCSKNKFEEKSVVNNNNTDRHQMLATELFCSLVGMSDMQYENLVYEKPQGQEKYNLVMIDADNAFNSMIMGRTIPATPTKTQSGFICNSLGSCKQLTIDEKLLTGLTDRMLDDSIVCRTVPIITRNHAEKRTFFANINSENFKLNEFYDYIDSLTAEDGLKFMENILNILKTPENPEVSVKEKLSEFGVGYNAKGRITDLSINGLLACISEYRKQFEKALPTVISDAKTSNQELWDAIKCAFQDYRDGRIPFYTFKPNDGKIYTHGNVVVGHVDITGPKDGYYIEKAICGWESVKILPGQ